MRQEPIKLRGSNQSGMLWLGKPTTSVRTEPTERNRVYISKANLTFYCLYFYGSFFCSFLGKPTAKEGEREHWVRVARVVLVN